MIVKCVSHAAKFGLQKIIVFIVASLTATLSFAQESGSQTPVETPSQPTTESSSAPANSTATSDAENADVEKINVTGSRLKMMRIEALQPTKVYTREEIEQSGASSVADLLGSDTMNSFGSRNDVLETDSKAPGVGHVDLRGIGRWRTLVLLDGKRLPTDPITSAVDLNAIPMSAVERIEILKDSASAVYGSDALGGVINIITRKNYGATEARMQYTKPQRNGGRVYDYSVNSATSNDTTKMTTSLQYREYEEIRQRDLPWEDGTSGTGSPGYYWAADDSGNQIVDPNCPASRISEDGNRCIHSYENSMVKPKRDQLNVFTTLEHEIFEEDLVFYGRAAFNRGRLEWEWDPMSNPSNPNNEEDRLLGRDYYNIPASRADTLGPDGGPLEGIEAGSDVSYAYRFKELGNRLAKFETTGVDLSAGFKGALKNDWEWDVGVSGSRFRRVEFGMDGYALKTRLRELISEADKGEGFNPFAPDGQRGSLDSAEYRPWDDQVKYAKQVDFTLSGDLYALPAGELSFATGTEFRSEEFSHDTDHESKNGNVLGNNNNPGKGSRKVKAYFLELGIPILSSVDMTLAARHDRYSDFGSATSPKVTLGYTPVDGYTFRATYSKGFKAPSIEDLYKGLENDPGRILICPEQGSINGCTEVASDEIYTGGNPKLKAEKSTSMNIGFVAYPTKNINFSIDFYRFYQENAISTYIPGIMRAYFSGQDVSKYGAEIDYDFENQRLNKAIIPLYNISKKEVRGMDSELVLKSNKYSFGQFTLDLDYSTQFLHKQWSFPGEEPFERLGKWNYPRWRFNTRTAYNYEAYSAALISKMIGPHGDEDEDDRHVGVYNIFDLFLSYYHQWDGKVSFTVKNLGDKSPPADRWMYDRFGRTYVMALSQEL